MQFFLGYLLHKYGIWKLHLSNVKASHLGFLNAGRDSVQDKRCLLKNKKLDLWLIPWNLMPSYNFDLEPLSPCNSEPLKQSKSSLSQMFFKIVSLKSFAIFAGKHLCWGLFLIKLQTFRPSTFKKRHQHRYFLWILQNF